MYISRADVHDQRREVIGIIGGIGTARRRARWCKAAMREGHAGIAAAEVRHLLPPAQMVAAKPVREHEHGPSTVYFVIEAAVRTVDVTALHRMVLRKERMCSDAEQRYVECL